MKQTFSVEYFTDEKNFSLLADLPWHLDLEDWHQVQRIKELNIRKGNHRHPVKFIDHYHKYLAIKQIPAHLAEKEIRFYDQLNRLGIATLTSLGWVKVNRPPVRMTGVIGQPLIQNDTGFLVTNLQRDVIPDKDLLGYGLSKVNEQKVWNSIIQLFVDLHANNIFWGDASLNNVLIRFKKVRYPSSARNLTILEGILVDTETMEEFPAISDDRRMEDWDLFFESLEWTLEDLNHAGVKKNINIPKLKKDMLKKYDHWLKITRDRQKFEEVTHLQTPAFELEWMPEGSFQVFLKQVEEHKWYLSEKKGKPVPLNEAAVNWYQKVFLPITSQLATPEIEELFPQRTPTQLFVEIMNHKYFLSLQKGSDVGTGPAIRDYVQRFGHFNEAKPLLKKFMSKLESQLSGYLQREKT